MEPAALVGAFGSALPALLLAAVVSVVLAVVAGLGLLRGRGHPALAALPVAIPLVVAEIGGVVALRGLPTDPARAVAVTVGMALVAVWFALPATGIVGVFAAVAGARGPVRRWRGAAVVGVAGLVTAGVTIAGGVAVEDWHYPALRAALYGLTGLLVAAAHVGADEAGIPTSGTAAAAGGCVFALVVAAGEASGRALETVFLLAVLPGVTPPNRQAYVDLALVDVIAPSAPWHDAALGLGCLTGVLAIGLVARSKPSLWAALVLVVVAVALGRLGAPDQAALVALAVAP